jgi:hypothetical protein
MTGDLEGEDLDCLRALARRGARVVCEANWTVVVAERRGRSSRREFAPDLIASLRRRGLVRDGAGGPRVSVQGLSALRRRLGEGTSSTASPHLRRRVGPRVAKSERPRVDAAENPLAWLRTRRDRSGRPMITAAEFQAGERLRADFHFAGLSPQVTANWDLGAPAGGSSGGERLTDRMLDARHRVARALSAVGPDLSGLLLDVCCFLRGIGDVEQRCGWPDRSAKVVLRIALRQLARHYGLIADDGRGEEGGEPTVSGEPSVLRRRRGRRP